MKEYPSTRDTWKEIDRLYYEQSKAKPTLRIKLTRKVK